MTAVERYRQVRARLAALLEESPLRSAAVRADVVHLMDVGEEELAFDTMCSWIHEDALPISSSYYARLVSAALELGTPRSAVKWDELVSD